jgi:hypothetical protein
MVCNNTNYCGVFVKWFDDIKEKEHVYLMTMEPILTSVARCVPSSLRVKRLHLISTRLQK